eukprot:TRINITY_DN20338_c0_g1_i2.p1 TRINITY_DN20338_c0_g1~~TRINITY_DN20338_c0_g1_i2.p1  ORF type:complete len:636 (-),score=92.66 TRINITY_DN20338_c0_g1_i2:235-2142(-)
MGMEPTTTFASVAGTLSWRFCLWRHSAVLGTLGRVFIAFHVADIVVAIGGSADLAPWYCPPIDAKARACVRGFRVGQARFHLEEVTLPAAVRVLMAVTQEPNVSSSYIVPAQAIRGLVETIKLISCSARFLRCYDADVFSRTLLELCAMAVTQERALAGFFGTGDPEADVDLICAPLLQDGDGGALMRAVARPLQSLVQMAFPEAAPPNLGNKNTRFDFEHFMEARGRLWTQRKADGLLSRPLALTYPAVFNPSYICDGVERGVSPSEDPDVDAFLKRLIDAGVPMSRFVVNFGAADGECGGPEDWNADPANCLTIAGYAALVIEGQRQFWPSLRKRYGNRTNVALVLQFVPLDGVTTLLTEHLQKAEGAAESPDLLKIDVDHADCLFLEEALRVIRPKLVHFEYAPQVPPPFAYVQHYQPSLLDTTLHQRSTPRLTPGSVRAARDLSGTAKSGDFATGSLGLELTGCSLSAFLSRTPDYDLAAVGDEEALLVRRDLQPALGLGPPPDVERAFMAGSFCHPLRGMTPGSSAWGFDFRVLSDPSAPEEERCRWLADMLMEHGASRFSIDIGGRHGWRSCAGLADDRRSSFDESPTVVGSAEIRRIFGGFERESNQRRGDNLPRDGVTTHLYRPERK